MINNPIRKLALAVTLALSCGALPAFADTTPSSATASVSDARREGQIWTSYAMNRHLRAFDLKVEVRGNKATLDGKVESGVEKDLAGQIAKGVEGITQVDNRIVVDSNYVAPKRVATTRNFGETVEDATITASVKSKLLWNSHTDGLDINVDTVNGQVTLTGTATTAAEKDLAGRLARNTSGVVAVNNQIAMGTGKLDGARADVRETKAEVKADARQAKAEVKESARDAKAEIKESARDAKAEVKEGAHDAKVATREAAHDAKEAVSDSWITAKVKSTLLLTSNVDGLDINVDTKDGNVILRGEVDSAAERERAVELAQNIRGVKKVDTSGIKVR